MLVINNESKLNAITINSHYRHIKNTYQIESSTFENLTFITDHKLNNHHIIEMHSF